MNFPLYLKIGQLKILLHAVTEVLGIFMGFRYFLYLRNKQDDPISSDNRVWIFIGAIFGALIGSRLVGVLENPQQLIQSNNLFVYIFSTKTVIGGLLGGLVGVEFIKKIVKEKQSSGDLFTYPLILGIMIGRVGCFSMGVYEETYGVQTNFIFGLNLGDGVIRHPVALYEIFFLAFLWIGIFLFEKYYELTQGSRFKLFMIIYLFVRFLIECIKPSVIIFLHLSTIQIVCLIGLVYYSSYIFRPKLFIEKKVKVYA